MDSAASVFQWIATTAVGIIVLLAAAWARHVTNMLAKLDSRLRHIEIHVGAGLGEVEDS